MTEIPCPYESEPQSDFESQYHRVLEVAECRTQVELAEFLEIKQSSISDAKRRQKIPSDWRIRLFEKKRINPEWILHGKGAKYLVPVDSEPSPPHIVRITETRPPDACSSQELFTELVRRAIHPLDIETIQRQVAATWFPAPKVDEKS